MLGFIRVRDNQLLFITEEKQKLGELAGLARGHNVVISGDVCHERSGGPDRPRPGEVQHQGQEDGGAMGGCEGTAQEEQQS